MFKKDMMTRMKSPPLARDGESSDKPVEVIGINNKTQQFFTNVEFIPRANRRGHPRLALDVTEIVRLREEKNYSFAQIAEVMHCGIITIWYRYRDYKKRQLTTQKGCEATQNHVCGADRAEYAEKIKTPQNGTALAEYCEEGATR